MKICISSTRIVGAYFLDNKITTLNFQTEFVHGLSLAVYIFLILFNDFVRVKVKKLKFP